MVTVGTGTEVRSPFTWTLEQRICGVPRCDGQGRVIGGMGALPGFGWWPIKAYKPCQALNEAGLEYTRYGIV